MRVYKIVGQKWGLTRLGCERGSIVVVNVLSRSEACGIFLDQGLNPCLLHQPVDSFTTETPGKPLLILWASAGPFSLASGGFLASPPSTLKCSKHGGWSLAYKKWGTESLPSLGAPQDSAWFHSDQTYLGHRLTPEPITVTRWIPCTFREGFLSQSMLRVMNLLWLT